MNFSFSKTAIRPEELRDTLTSAFCGGYSSFEGWVRDHNEGKSVSLLEYEAYEALAVKEGERIIAEALEKYQIDKAACVHRVGALAIGDLAVWVGVSAAHRDAAFQACRYIIDQVKVRVPIWKKEHYSQGNSGWVNCEHCHAHGQAWQSDYSRQTQLPQVGTAGQQKLSQSRVLIIGVGGLGCPALSYLVGAGIGTIGLADADRLDASNLHRQTIFNANDVGQPKAELASNYAKRINPNVVTKPYVRRLSSNEIVDVFNEYDVVLDCTDNLNSKQLISDASVLCNKPLVTASVYQYEGQLQVFGGTTESVCFRCIWPDSDQQTAVLNCQESGVLGPVPGIFGCMQALEAIKLLLDFDNQLGNDMLLINLLSFETRRIRTKKGMHSCREIIDLKRYQDAENLEIDFANLSDARQAGLTIIDIRDVNEMDANPLSQAVELNRCEVAWHADEKYLLVCVKGMRSKAMAVKLAEDGISAFSLRGGLEALVGARR